jgi:hypothetical protein
MERPSRRDLFDDDSDDNKEEYIPGQVLGDEVDDNVKP